jgi:hypothetical protein
MTAQGNNLTPSLEVFMGMYIADAAFTSGALKILLRNQAEILAKLNQQDKEALLGSFHEQIKELQASESKQAIINLFGSEEKYEALIRRVTE